uniref:FMRFamide-related neuropeptides-like n=1 Tax=Heterorhabditis bacteriophora TaxID=37862 RepID=A0A1I7XSV5_HETBA
MGPLVPIITLGLLCVDYSIVLSSTPTECIYTQSMDTYQPLSAEFPKQKRDYDFVRFGRSGRMKKASYDYIRFGKRSARDYTSEDLLRIRNRQTEEFASVPFKIAT